MPRMSQKEFKEAARCDYYHLVYYPVLLILGIYVVGAIIETTMGLPLGVAKQIFAGIGGIAYFINYFRTRSSR